MTIDKVLSMDGYGKFKDAIEQLSDEEMKVFVPDVYQQDIYLIDYDRLWKSGVRLVTYDIDDTIGDLVGDAVAGNVPGFEFKLPKVKQLVSNLKSKGFKVAILTNANKSTAEEACKAIGADYFHFRAEKPAREGFELMLERFGLEPSQMAHVGDSIRMDVSGGNRVGVTTCLVRRKGVMGNLLKGPVKVLGHTRDQAIYKELEKRKMWSRHHVLSSGDQYYQFGKKPGYLSGMSNPSELLETVGIYIDGRKTTNAALNLQKIISDIGIKTARLSEPEEVAAFPGRVIVVGHHDFADDLLERLPLEYDLYGMRFGYNDRLCVLNASRRALMLHRGGEGRDAFERYYDKAVSEYPELAKKYNILPTFDHSEKKTKDFQYDLLWLEFVKYGLEEFLDIDLDIDDE